MTKKRMKTRSQPNEKYTLKCQCTAVLFWSAGKFNKPDYFQALVSCGKAAFLYECK